VAGLHRLLSRHDEIRRARVLVVVAGMEGALASVVGGLVDRPVIAVPTSAGYGMNLQGVTTLLAMMNACAPNVSVVNVDNGFGAGYVATLINRTAEGDRPETR
jgi:pyridinium-3,5-biscarboxylic acid mononucleotide synthase